MTFMDTGEPGYFNRYAYTMNDPINLIDPNGESSCGITGGTNYGCNHLESHGGDTAAAAADMKYTAQELGKATANLPVETINGAVDIAAAVSPTATVAGTPDIPLPFDNVDPQASATVNTLAIVAGGAKAATKAPAAASAVGDGLVRGSGAAIFGKNGSLFGRGGKQNGGIFNSNDVLRVGYSWKGGAKTGNHVFRVGWGKKGSKLHGHTVLHTFKKPLP